MLTFHAEKINVYDLLTQIVHEAEGTLEIREDEVTIKTRKVEPSPGPVPSKAAADVS